MDSKNRIKSRVGLNGEDMMQGWFNDFKNELTS